MAAAGASPSERTADSRQLSVVSHQSSVVSYQSSVWRIPSTNRLTPLVITDPSNTNRESPIIPSHPTTNPLPSTVLVLSHQPFQPELRQPDPDRQDHGSRDQEDQPAAMAWRSSQAIKRSKALGG
jgi:hypothetical protein